MLDGACVNIKFQGRTNHLFIQLFHILNEEDAPWFIMERINP